MQTWLPKADFTEAAKTLRDKELGRQRIDAKLALIALLFPERKSAWRFHPVCRMWKGYECALFMYYQAIVQEWRLRGRKYTVWLDKKVLRKANSLYLIDPWWLNKFEFHDAQRATLIRRFGEHYEKQFGSCWDSAPVWPVMRSGKRNESWQSYTTKEDVVCDIPF